MSSFLSLRWNASVTSGDRYSSPPSRYADGFMAWILDKVLRVWRSLCFIQPEHSAW